MKFFCQEGSACEEAQDRLTSIITLTTDFGVRDGFVAQMKGVILGINPRAKLIDVTHEIAPFSVLEGALVLKDLSRYFPRGTIHVGVVDPGVGGERRGIVVRSEDHVYVGPDNGLFSLVLSGSKSWEVREIANPDYTLPRPHPTFHGRDVFAPVAAHLSLGELFDDVGNLIDDPVLVAMPAINRTDSGIEGEVIHIDRFGNLVSNVEAAVLDRPVHVVRTGNVEIKGISRFFGEAEKGRALALINSFGYLEVAVNGGDASRLLGIEIGERIEVLWGG